MSIPTHGPSPELWHLVPRLHGRRVLVFGDIMLDRFIYGEIVRISPEAPVPVLKHGDERRMLGGAGNVAANLRSLGGAALLVGLIGRDDGRRRGVLGTGGLRVR